MIAKSFARAFIPVLLLGSLAAADGITGQLNGKPWTATTAVVDAKFPAEAGWWSVTVSAGEVAPALLLKVPCKVGIHPLGGKVSATMFVPPGDNEQADDGTIEVVSIGEHVVLRLNITVSGANKVSGTIEFAAPAK